MYKAILFIKISWEILLDPDFARTVQGLLANPATRSASVNVFGETWRSHQPSVGHGLGGWISWNTLVKNLWSYKKLWKMSIYSWFTHEKMVIFLVVLQVYQSVLPMPDSKVFPGWCLRFTSGSQVSNSTFGVATTDTRVKKWMKPDEANPLVIHLYNHLIMSIYSAAISHWYWTFSETSVVRRCASRNHGGESPGPFLTSYGLEVRNSPGSESQTYGQKGEQLLISCPSLKYIQ